MPHACDAHVDFAHLRLGHDCARLALDDLAAEIEDDQARETTASSACTICSIQTIVTPDCMIVRIERDQLVAFGFGQAAGDLVEQQQARAARQRARQFEPLAVEQVERAGAAIGLPMQTGALQNSPQASTTCASRCRRPRMAATSRFSNTVRFSNGCGIWIRAADAGDAARLRAARA